MWLEAFNLDIEKPTYDANVMKVLLMFYEEQLLMVKFNGSGGDGFKVVKKFSNLSDVDITWFAKEKGE